eukprot:CAMPEP_0114569852 /NCGR_PEP_ID=MMETSP0114-20121206/16865_1 /TAXON_ID=31324 /ORGANISM="Goniomonas sp, Strain m" /LENGTH=104 /DNA_ID=CAMNT_0001756795 /DNA_START=91 /DNA_END=401 /DNA_ORIENTATION=-
MSFDPKFKDVRVLLILSASAMAATPSSPHLTAWMSSEVRVALTSSIRAKCTVPSLAKPLLLRFSVITFVVGRTLARAATPAAVMELQLMSTAVTDEVCRRFASS